MTIFQDLFSRKGFWGGSNKLVGIWTQPKMRSVEEESRQRNKA